MAVWAVSGLVSSSAERVLARHLRQLLLWAEWGLTLAAVGLSVSSKDYQPILLSIGGLIVTAWVMRWARIGVFTRTTLADFPLAVFLFSAFVGLWAAPDQGAALVRLYLFLAAAGLFYTMINSSLETLITFSSGLNLFAVLLSVYFVTQNNWIEQPAKFAFVGEFGTWLNRVVPDFGLYKPHPNVVSSMLAVVAPITLVRLVESFHKRGEQRNIIAIVSSALWSVCCAILVVGLVMTESRAAWLALLSALSLAAWWAISRKLEGRVASLKVGMIFWAGVGLMIAVAVVSIALYPEWVTTIVGKLPGPNSAVSRMDIYGQVWRLAQDTPFTGGGLAAFSALYSTYILVIPHLFLTHAHNTYLNVLVEQGWLGLIGYIGLLGVASWKGVASVAQGAGTQRMLAIAGALGLAVVAIQGLADATLVASRAIPVLLIPAGFALAVSGNLSTKETSVKSTNSYGLRLRFWSLGFAVLVAGVAVVFNGRQLVADFHANVGAVTHHRLELTAWPTGQWDDGHSAKLYVEAESELRKALDVDPKNRTALQLLGIEAGFRRDFIASSQYLRRAYDADTGHKGIMKSLGYAYVWAGDLDQAAGLLASVPEARADMLGYAWWWETQGRADLAGRARTMGQRLGN